MKICEAQARQIVLAQAIETADIQGKLISDVERDQIDTRIAREMCKSNAPGTNMGTALAERAATLLEIAQGRNRVIASLQRAQHLQHSMTWVLPVSALILGVVVDRVFNPHRVDLLSEPFLGVLIWNLVVYTLIVLSIVRRPQQQPTSWIDALRHWIAGAPIWQRERNSIGTDIAIQFSSRWRSLTAALTGQRLLHMMHLAAAAWGAGVALSLIFRGTVRAYTIGWESTLLNSEQVHFVLYILSWPLVRIFGIDSFTIEDIARLQFDIGAGATGNDGSRWLWMYVGLLLVFVVLPRLALAAISAWRGKQLAKHINIDLDEPYFQRIIDNLSPATARLCVLTHHADDSSALKQILVQERAAGSDRSAQSNNKLIGTERGDTLWTDEVTTGDASKLFSLPHAGANAQLTKTRWPGWRKWFDTHGESQQTAPNLDVVLHVVSQAQDLTSALPVLQDLRLPVLILVRSSKVSGALHAELFDQCRLHQRNNDLSMDILDFDDFACCWVQERALLDAIARRMPRSKTQGYARLTTAWEQRSRMRFTAAMAVIVDTLTYAARQSEEISKLSLIDRVSSEKRQAHEMREQSAMETVLNKVRHQDHAYVQTLLSVHNLEIGSANALMLNGKFAIQTAVSAPQAAMGGLATGAAMGASIDLLTGGMTLGAAAALGALAGGSVALVGALWNNRTTPNGGIRISLSDEMLLAFMQACLLRYLAVVHLHRDNSGTDENERQEMWKIEVIAEMQARKKHLLLLIEDSRKGDEMHSDFICTMEKIGRQVLQRLYPSARFE